MLVHTEPDRCTLRGTRCSPSPTVGLRLRATKEATAMRRPASSHRDQGDSTAFHFQAAARVRWWGCSCWLIVRRRSGGTTADGMGCRRGCRRPLPHAGSCVASPRPGNARPRVALGAALDAPAGRPRATRRPGRRVVARREVEGMPHLARTSSLHPHASPGLPETCPPGEGRPLDSPRPLCRRRRFKKRFASLSQW